MQDTVPVESDFQVKMDKIPNIVKIFLLCSLIQVISASDSDMDCGVTEGQTTTPLPVDPCNSDPCGPHSQCRSVNNFAACSCLPGYRGSPPNCQPECRRSIECASNLTCINQKCRDPCPGACGASTECEVINHNTVCRCQQGFEGDPYEGCQRVRGEYLKT